MICSKCNVDVVSWMYLPDGSTSCSECTRARIAELEEQLRERDAECLGHDQMNAVLASILGGDVALDEAAIRMRDTLTARAESAETALAAARDENERLRERLKLGPPGSIGHSMGVVADSLGFASEILGIKLESADRLDRIKELESELVALRSKEKTNG